MMPTRQEDAAQNYRPDIDGLRAIAVISVVLFHFYIPQVPGGYVGVDVFFVISGYLITKIIFDEIADDRFSLARFYERRARRILPALLAMILVTFVAGYWLLAPGNYVTLAESAVAAIFSFANIFFLTNTGYFDAASHSMPLLHTWSLSVEEQFYFVWPLLLLVPFWRGHRKASLCFVAIVVIFGFIACTAVTLDDKKLAFYLPFTRAWELALGGAIVFLRPIRQQVLAEFGRIIGLLMIASAIMIFPADASFPGWRAAIPAIGSALIIFPSQQQTVVAKALSASPLVFIGKISYSLYLWHWPLSVYWRTYSMDRFTPAEQVSLISLSIVLAWLSWRFIEQPFRKPSRRPVRILLISGAAMASVASAALLIGLSEGLVFRIPEEHRNLSSLEATWKWDCPSTSPLKLPTNCVAGATWDSAKARGLIWGDSHAEHWMPILHKAASDAGVSVALHRSCIAIVHPNRAKLYDQSPDCSMREQIVKLVRSDPSIRFIILAGEWHAWAPLLYRNNGDERSPDIGFHILMEELSSLVSEFNAMNVRIAIATEMALFPQDPVPCVIFSRRCTPWVTNYPRTHFDNVQRKYTEGIRALASKATVLVPTDRMCNNTTCRTFVGGEFIYRDRDHIRRNLTPQAISVLSEETGAADIMKTLSASE